MGALIATWKSFYDLPFHERSQYLSSPRGGHTICEQVQEVLRNLSYTSWPLQPGKWEGAFTRLQVLVGVRGYRVNEQVLEYEVDDDGVMRARIKSQSAELEYATFSKIRVLAYNGSKWFIDPPLEEIKPHWMLIVFEKKPLTRLQWDPRRLWWKDPYDYSGRRCGFFQYSVKVG